MNIVLTSEGSQAWIIIHFEPLYPRNHMPDEEHNGVTVIVTERVADNQHSAFEKELAAVIAALAAMPGNLGVNVIRPGCG